MSNNPSQRVVVRIQPAALVFVVLVLIFGALILASNNLDPNSVKRAQFSPTPIDYFAAIKYSNWKSSDGLVQIDYPTNWTPINNPNGIPFEYRFGPNDPDGPAVVVAMGPLPAGQTPTQFLSQNMPNPAATAQAHVNINPVEYAGLKGESTLQTVTTTDALGQPAQRTVEQILLNLDSQNIVLITSVSSPEDWLKMQPIVDHMANSLALDNTTVLKKLSAAEATPEESAGTPNAASAANAAASAAATSAATSAVTPAPTTAATPAASAPATGTKSF